MTEVTAGRSGMSGTAVRRRGDTRQRILDTALALFADRGYAGTSVRDIAEELGLTKAAVHYHFAAKEQMIPALLAPMMEQCRELLDRSAAAPADPRAVLLGLRDLLTTFGPLMAVLMSDPSVGQAAAEVHDELDALAVRTAGLLAGPDPSPARTLRAHAALGAFFGGWNSAYRAAGSVSEGDLEVVLEAALAALGD